MLSGIARCCAIGAAVLACNAAAQTDVAPPPRTVEDVVRALDQYRQDPELERRARSAAQAQPPANADPKSLMYFYLNRGRAASAIGAGRQQIDDLKQAVSIARSIKSEDLPVTVQELASAESTIGNLVSALKGFEELARITPQSQFGRMMGAYGGIAQSHINVGDLSEARQALRRAESVFSTLQGYRAAWGWWRYNWTAGIERIRGVMFAAEGNLPEAENAMRRALVAVQEDVKMNLLRLKSVEQAVTPQVVIERFEIVIMWQLSRILREAGKLSEAEAQARRSLELAVKRHGRYSSETGISIANIAAAVYEQGRYAEAEQLARVAVDAMQKSGAAPESVILANMRRAGGWALSAQEKWGGTIAAFEEMKAGVAHDPDIARRFGAGDINWGYALVRTGAVGPAVEMLRQVYERSLGMAGEQDYRTMVARGYYAVALAAKGEQAAALGEFMQAVPALIEQQRADQGADVGGAARVMHLSRIVESYIALLMEYAAAGTPVPGLDPVAESFRLADVARGSNVQRALTESAARASIPDPQLAALARGEQDASRRVGVLSEILSGLLAAPPEQQLPNVIAKMKKDVEALRAERVKLKREIERRFPEYARLVDPRPVTLAQARAVLQADEALVSIYSAADRTYVWAFRKEGPPAFAQAPLGRRQAAEMVSGLRRALDVGDATLEAFPNYDVALAHRLYQLLLEPVASGWRGAPNLLVAPHLTLGQIPFALLVTAPATLKAGAVRFDEYKAVPWLLRDVAVSQLPSVISLVALRSLPPASGGRESFAGFGDPIFSKAQMQIADAGTAQTRGLRLRNLTVAKVGTPIAAPDATTGAAAAPPAVANSSTMAQLARLPDTADEIREIALALGADGQRDVFLGARATEQRVKTLDLSKRRVVAFATHGLVPGDLNGLTQPALALTAPEIAGGTDDGLLTMDEILPLKLNADWIVLSACNTASGDGAGSEAVSGLGRAFFYAGARALLVSNWPVETVSARILTTELFRRQARDPGLARGEALRQTMLALIDAPQAGAGTAAFSYAHPLFWAPFSLVGDGASR